jgi:hypothetical protein
MELTRIAARSIVDSNVRSNMAWRRAEEEEEEEEGNGDGGVVYL